MTTRPDDLTDSTGGTANTTLAAIPDPTDSPASADALRDELTTNVLPKIRDALADLAAQVNRLTGTGGATFSGGDPTANDPTTNGSGA